MADAQTVQLFNNLTNVINTRINDVLNRQVQQSQYIAAILNQQAQQIFNQINTGDNRVISQFNATIQATNNFNNQLAQTIINNVRASIVSEREYTTSLFNSVQNNILKAVQNQSQQTITYIKELQNFVSSSIGQIVNNVAKINETYYDKINQLINDIVKSNDNPIVGAISRNSGYTGADSILNIGITEKLFADMLYGTNLSGLGGNNSVSSTLSGVGDAIKSFIDLYNGVYEGRIDTYDKFKKAFDTVGVSGDFISEVIKLLGVVGFFQQALSLMASPVVLNMQDILNDKFDIHRLSADEIATLYTDDKISKDYALNGLKKLGYKTEEADLLLKSLTDKLPPEILVRLYQRGYYNANEYGKAMERHGFSNGAAYEYAKGFEPIPSVSDMVRFALRDVYNLGIAQKYGLNEDYPAKFTQEAKKLGLSEEYAKQYWAAHWDLPSPNMGYEMYQRGIIDLDTLRELLKSLDIMPYWRDKLIQLAYNPVTRVDIRRLYSNGIYSYNDVYKAYLNAGYSPKDAKDLADFTVKVEANEDTGHKQKLKDLTYSLILKAYTRGIIDRQSAVNQLTSLGYDVHEVALLLDLTDYEQYIKDNPERKTEYNTRLKNIAVKAYTARAISQEDLIEYLIQAGYSRNDAVIEAQIANAEYSIAFKADIATEIKKLYLEGIYDNNQVYSSLTELDFTSNEAKQILDELVVMKSFRYKKPTEAQFRSLLKSGYITPNDYAEELRNEGYADKYIPYMLALAGYSYEG